jgi:hypothetical protein
MTSPACCLCPTHTDRKPIPYCENSTALVREEMRQLQLLPVQSKQYLCLNSIQLKCKNFSKISIIIIINEHFPDGDWLNMFPIEILPGTSISLVRSWKISSSVKGKMKKLKVGPLYPCSPEIVCLNSFNICQHYIDDRSQFKVHIDEWTRVHSAQSSLEVDPSKY